MMDLQRKLKMARAVRGLTMEQAAERYGGTKQQWHQWESGMHEPGMTTVHRIAAALDMSVVELLTIDQNPATESVA